MNIHKTWTVYFFMTPPKTEEVIIKATSKCYTNNSKIITASNCKNNEEDK